MPVDRNGRKYRIVPGKGKDAVPAKIPLSEILPEYSPNNDEDTFPDIPDGPPIYGEGRGKVGDYQINFRFSIE